MSVTEMLATLQSQIAEHREQAALHAQQETYHREEAARHAAELERVEQRFRVLEAAVSEAEQVLRPPEPPPPPPPVDDDLGDRPVASRALTRVLEAWPPGTPFGPSALATETNRRFAAKLRRPITIRAASVFLRRRRDEGRLAAVRDGRAYHEAMYQKPG